MALGLPWALALLAVFLSVLIADVMGLFRSKNHFDVNGRTVLITGGSQGMGKGVAKLLASKGANVVIVARRKEVLDEALEEISASAKNPGSQRFLSLAADVTSMSENQRIFDETSTWNNGQPPDVVWAIAGAAFPTLFLDSPVETLRSQMDLNYFAAAYLAQVTLRAWTNPVQTDPDSKANERSRHLIFTSSIGSCLGLPGYTPYAPAKSALRSLADQLQAELCLYNGAREKPRSNGPKEEIKIHCVLPGTIKSPGYETEEKCKPEITKILEKGDIVQTGDEVASAAVKGLEAGGFLVSTQMMGSLLRGGMMGGSPRHGIGFVDTVWSIIASIAWLFVRPDLDAKVYKYGKKNGMPK